MMNTSTVQHSYDQVARDYAEHVYGELPHKPFDRKMLELLVEKVNGRGAICDLGCGPGQVARYLHERGAEVIGIDLSPAMIEQAQELNPGIRFQQGDMLALTDVEDSAFGGIAAFYSLVHVPRTHVVTALRELRRVLQPGGVLLTAFHVGSEVRHPDEWWGKPINVDFFFFEREEMKAYLGEAGFMLAEIVERDPYPEGVEVQTRRAYLFARKPEFDVSP